MDAIFTLVFYGAAICLCSVSFWKDSAKTRLALTKALKLFWNVLPQFAAISVLAGLMLAAVSPPAIRGVMGSQSGTGGMLAAGLLGAAAVVPALAALSIVAELLHTGAGLSQMTVFICTLTTVGLVSLPLEIQYLGRKAAALRNLLFFLAAFLIASLLEVILS